jgi:hypothetical protein
MKYKSLGLTVLLAAFAGSGLAQSHISGTGKCKPDTSQSIEAGDQPGHMLVIMKISCTYNPPLEIGGLKSATYSVAESSEVIGANFDDRGYGTLTMENGDKVYVRTKDTGSFKESGALTDDGTWSITGGTGKLQGITGKGTL